VQDAVASVVETVPAWPAAPAQAAAPAIPWLPQLPELPTTLPGLPPTLPRLPTTLPAVVPVPAPRSLVQEVESSLTDAGFGPGPDVFRIVRPRVPRAAAAPRTTILWSAPAQPTASVPLPAVAAEPRAHTVEPRAVAAPAAAHARAPERAPRDPDPRGPGDGLGAVESGAGLGGLLLPTIAALLGACLLLPPRRFRRPVGRRARLPQQPGAERRERPG
jgi:hypothetical protein